MSMPVSPTYPGVYIEELPSAVRTIIGVPTAVTAFVGTAPRGAADTAVEITSYAEFERKFGDLSPRHPMGYAVYHFYQNGGQEAGVVRVLPADAATAGADLPGGVRGTASGAGARGERLCPRGPPRPPRPHPPKPVRPRNPHP